MIEAGIAAAIALITGSAALTNRLHKRIDEVHSRITEVDRRVDSAELHIARNYVFKTDFENAFRKMETHMVRIEDKLDQIMMNKNG